MNFLDSITWNVILGNIVSILGCTVMVLVGLVHEKKRILEVQCLQFTLMGISHGLLGGWGGVASCVVSIARNLAVFKTGHFTVKLKLIFIAIMGALSVATITLNPITWIPFVATAIFTWYIDCECVIKFKWVMIITVLMWLVYDLAHLNFVSSAFDIFTAISTYYSIVQIKKRSA